MNAHLNESICQQVKAWTRASNLDNTALGGKMMLSHDPWHNSSKTFAGLTDVFALKLASQMALDEGCLASTTITDKDKLEAWAFVQVHGCLDGGYRELHALPAHTHRDKRRRISLNRARDHVLTPGCINERLTCEQLHLETASPRQR
jgi:hypothetical protein